jgi:phosphoribosylamine--glycine ligase
MGDPESEVVFPRIQSDVVELFDAAATGNLKDFKLKINPQTAATIMLVSCGYPEKFEKGKKIHNLDKIKETKAYHAGTTEKNNELYTNGGRVVSLTSFGNSMNEALQKSIIAAEIIDFEGKYYRKDIGFDLKQISDLRKV